MPIIGIIASSIKKAFASFSDTFNRTTSGSLGTSSSGGLWKALRGVWFANGNAAQSNDAATSYPIANIEMTKSDVTASITTGSWVQISTTGTVGSISSNSADSTTYYTATITGMSSTTGMAVGQRISATNGTGSLFGGTPDYVEITAINSSSSITYRTRGGTTPTAGSVSNILTANNDGGSGISLWITDSGNWWGVSYGRSINTSCNCQTCNVCLTYANYQGFVCGAFGYSASYGCNGWTNYASYSCNSWGWQTTWTCTGWSGSTTYSCSSWQTTFEYVCFQWGVSGYSCTGWGLTGYSCLLYQRTGPGFTAANYSCVEWGDNYACNSWSANYGCTDTLPQWTTTCNGWSGSTTYSCSSWSSSSSQVCNSYVASWSPSCSSYQLIGYNFVCNSYTSAWSPACSSYGFTTCNCQTCYPPYIRVFQSVSNAVSEITRWTLGTMAAAFKVITNGTSKVITIRPYKEVSMTTQIGADLTYTATGATITKKFGIVLSPSDNIQGTTLDDFNINSN